MNPDYFAGALIGLIIGAASGVSGTLYWHRRQIRALVRQRGADLAFIDRLFTMITTGFPAVSLLAAIDLYIATGIMPDRKEID